MNIGFQRRGGVSPRYDLHPEDCLSPEEAAAQAAEYIAYENARQRRIKAEQDRADRIAKTARWHEFGAYWDRRAKGDGSHELSFQETYGFDPEWP